MAAYPEISKRILIAAGKLYFINFQDWMRIQKELRFNGRHFFYYIAFLIQEKQTIQNKFYFGANFLIKT